MENEVIETQNPNSRKKHFLRATLYLLAGFFLMLIGSYLFKPVCYCPSPVSCAISQPAQEPIEPSRVPTKAAGSDLLNEYPNKELVGENQYYSVYMVNVSVQKLFHVGEMVVYDKTRKQLIKINGTFDLVQGLATIVDDGQGEYVLLSGMGSLNKVISLSSRKEAIKGFCGSEARFWKYNIVYENCDVFENRPWGGGEASSIDMINLLTDETKTLLKSDLLQHFRILKIEKNNLIYEEVSVKKDTDWENYDETQQVSVQTYNLSSVD